jgi:pimeloyl-ACP methyl ester carboxylesterase
MDALFYNGVDAAVVAADVERAQSDTPSLQPWPEDALPRVPTSFVILRDDRFFPEPFMRRVVSDRLGIAPVTIPGGHMAMLSHPVELTERLITEAARLSVAPSS